MFFSWLGPSGWTSICKTVFMFARIAVFVSHFQVIATEALWGGHESHPSNLQNMMNACIFDTSSLLQPVYIYIPIPVAKQNKPAMTHSTCVAVQGLPMLLHDFHLAQVCPEVPQLDEGAFFVRKLHYWPCGHHTLQWNILVLMGC